MAGRIIPITRKGLTGRMIYYAADDILIQRSRYVAVLQIRKYPNAYGQSTYMATVRTMRENDGTMRPHAKQRNYKVNLRVTNKQGHMLVDCECRAHPYWGAEVSLSLRDAAKIRRSDGSLPTIRRPDYRSNTSACKHVTAVLRKLLDAKKI